MERAGISLKSKLFSSNPWAKEGCSRSDCFSCTKRGGGSVEENVTFGPQGKPAPVSHFTQKYAARAAKAVDSYNCLSTTKAAQAKDNWEYETVLFVPVTPNGALATALRAYEKKRGAKRRIRIMERAGISLKSKLFLRNSWAKEGW